MGTIPIRKYLASKGIEFKEIDGELITKCLFSACRGIAVNSPVILSRAKDLPLKRVKTGDSSVVPPSE